MIERDPKREPYTAVRNRIIYSEGLSLEELGLYTAMLSRPVNWDFSEFVLARDFSVPASRIRSILESLAKKGYTRERKGRYGTVWDLFEQPAQRNVSAEVMDLIAKTAKAASMPKPSAPKQETEPEPPKRTLSDGQMAQAFFDQAEKLRERNEYKKKNGVWPD